MPEQPARKIRVALVFGGRSSEHAISCATAASVLTAIDRDRYDVLPLGISRDGDWVVMPDDPEPLRIVAGRLPEVPAKPESVAVVLASDEPSLRVVRPDGPSQVLGDIDVVFPLLHGPFGEDGTLQGLLELTDIRYVGCGVAASAVMMDKALMKTVFAQAGLPQTPTEVITDRQWLADPDACVARAADLQFPVFVKPARAGSSMGVTKVSDPTGLAEAIEAAREHDPKVVVEQGVFGRELEVGVLQGHGSDAPRVSPVGEIEVVKGHNFYDFDAKYLDEESVSITIPADVPEEVSAEIRRIAAVAFEAAGCEGLARVDTFYADDGRVLINEINTMPGFTPYSMFPRAWAAAGMTYPELIDDLISLALERRVGLR